MKCPVLILLLFVPLGCAHIAPPSTSQDQFTSTLGNRYFTIEKGRGRSIVILHGLPDHSLNQLHLIEELSASHQVFAYDRLGMGLSDKPKRNYDIPEQTRDLEAILSAKHFEKPVLLGHSIGGTIAVRYAAQHPEMISALILMNPVLIFEPGHTGLRDWNTWLMKQPIIGETIMALHSRSVTKAILKHMFYDDTKVTDEVVDSYYFPIQEKGAKRHFLGTLRSLYEIGPDALLKDVDTIREQGVPVLLIWTAKDPDMPVSDAPVLAKRLSARLVLIEECGHLPQIELSSTRFTTEIIAPIQEFVKEVADGL